MRQLKQCQTCKTLVPRDADAAKCILLVSVAIWLTGERPYNLDWARPAPQGVRSAPFHLRLKSSCCE